MRLSSINQYFGNADIYLLDLILKNKFQLGMKVLDAGCGEGRNLVYFLNAGYTVFGVDKDPQAIDALRFIAGSIRPDLSRDHFQVAELETLPYQERSFDLIIASAVLHFASSEGHFKRMFAELVRCLKPAGILFIRMTSDIGIEEKIVPQGQGNFLLPDGTRRYLLTRKQVDQLVQLHSLKFLQPLKTVNVNDKRCMSTLVLTATV